MNQPLLFSEVEMPMLPQQPREVLLGLGQGGEVDHRAVKRALRKAYLQKLKASQLDIWSILAKPIVTTVAGLVDESLDDLWTAIRRLHVAGSDIKETLTTRIKAIATSKDPYTWRDEEHMALHVALLDESLDVLKAEGRIGEKIDVLDWIFSPPYIEKIGTTADGRRCLQRRHATDIPFSFVRCCRAAGLTNPDLLREELVSHMSDDIRDRLKVFLDGYFGTGHN